MRSSAARAARKLVGMALCALATMGAECPPTEPEACDPSKGTIRFQDVTVAELGTGLPLGARIYAPDPTAYPTRPYPAIGILPAGLSDTDSVDWAAQRLAGSGYVAIEVRPSNGGSPDSYDLALRGALDFLGSADNPYRADTDLTRIGIAGWSLGARSLSKTQDLDSRVKAVVAWDNLAVRETGDEGSPTCAFTGTEYRTPRVPAMGQASDDCVVTDPEAKKAAFSWWRANRTESMEVVFAASTHSWFGSGWTPDKHDLIHWYTHAWFDRWLKGDTTATGRLLTRTVCSQDVAGILDTDFRSGAYLDGHDCADLQAGCS